MSLPKTQSPLPHNTVNIFPGQHQVISAVPPAVKQHAPIHWHAYQQPQALHHSLPNTTWGNWWQQHQPAHKVGYDWTQSDQLQHHHHQHYAQQPYYPTTPYPTPYPHPAVHYGPQPPPPAHQPHFQIQASPQQLRHAHQHVPYPSPAHHTHAHAAQKSPEANPNFFYHAAGEHPGPGAQGRNLWHGRSKAQVQADEQKYARNHGGYNAREPGPRNAAPGEMFLVVEANGEQSWRSYATIEHSMGPGRWDQGTNGQMFFTRFNA